MPYFLQGKIWDQNMCCEAKWLHKTLVTNIVQIFKNLNEVFSRKQKTIISLKSKLLLLLLFSNNMPNLKRYYNNYG